MATVSCEVSSPSKSEYFGMGILKIHNLVTCLASNEKNNTYVENEWLLIVREENYLQSNQSASVCAWPNLIGLEFR